MRAGLAAALVTLVALVTGSNSVAQTTVTRDVYFNFLAFICTTGEDVLFEGTIQVREGSHTDAAGGTHGTAMTLIHQSGVGQTTGTRYQLTQVNPFAVNFFDPNGESTGVIRFRVTQQGGGVIFHDFDVHLTITPDGDVVVFRVDDESGCHGNFPNAP